MCMYNNLHTLMRDAGILHAHTSESLSFTHNTLMHMWQSQVENEHYSYHFLTTFLSSHYCNLVSKPPRKLILDVQ